jgi:branched-chain amino acid transport system ATP-binding protein
VLTISSLTVGYGKATALHAVDVRVDAGECVSVIGPNGAGKSTLLRAIAGLTPARSGTITFLGDEIQRAKTDQIVGRRLILCPEGRKLVGTMSVEDNLRLGAYLQRADVEAELARVYELFPVLAERRRQQAGTLSGGQQQMVAIGRALMAKPKLLMLDELSLGLSPLLTQTIGEKLQALHRHGLTILLVEQNAELALTLSERCYVLEAGVMTRADSTAALRKDEDIRRAYLGL